jgi:hypothetical protein
MLAQLARGVMRGKIAALQEAFTGFFTGHHSFRGQVIGPRHPLIGGAGSPAATGRPDCRSRHLRAVLMQ